MSSRIKHHKEFEYYYNQGNSRSYRKVAEHFGVKMETVVSWAKPGAEGWVAEVNRRDKEIAEAISAEVVQDRADVMVGHLKTINRAKGIFDKNIEEGKVDISNMKDYQRLVNMEIAIYEMLDKMKADEEGRGQEIKLVFNINEKPKVEAEYGTVEQMIAERFKEEEEVEEK